MTHKTKGIVIRVIKYGETSVVATLFTELFGIQTYLINGVRKAQKKSGFGIMLQPGAILDLEVYHNDSKNMQRIKEANWSFIYEHLLSDVIKNSILTYLLELLFKSLKQPEPNADLFYFCEDALLSLDVAEDQVTANFALYFSLQLPHFFGFKIHNPDPQKINHQEIYLDLAEGGFTEDKPLHNHFIQGDLAFKTYELLMAMHPNELSEIKLNKETRRNLLLAYQQYYALHLNDFGQIRSLKILQEVIG